MGGLEGLDPPAGSRGGAPGGGAGAKPLAGSVWSVRDCSGNPAGSVLPVFVGTCYLPFVFPILLLFVFCLPRNWRGKPDPVAERKGNAQNMLKNTSTESELTFLHELSHAVDHHITNHESGYDYDLGEVVAELSASCPASLYGKGVENIYHTRKYIEGYSKNPGQHPAIVIAKAVERVEKIYHYIDSLGEPDVN